MNGTIDILRGELERLFSLDDLTKMSRDHLGLDPQEIGGETAKGSFARALAEKCIEGDRVDALVDVMLFSKKTVDPRVYDAVSKTGRDQVEVGKSIGGFVVQKVVEDSEFAFVAECVRNERPFTVKVLKRLAIADRRALHRFLTANRLVGSVQHAGLPQGIEAAELADGTAYVAHETIDGEPLSNRFSRGPQAFADVKGILRAVLDPLAALHRAGLVHGDLKLDHVVITKSGSAVLIDFGGDKLRHRATPMNGHGGYLAVLGSPRGVAPEIVRGKPADARSDMYALGVMLYEMLTGKTPFESGSPADTVFAHLTKSPPPPSTLAPSGWVPKDVDSLVGSLLDKDPSRRPQNAAELAQRLERLGVAPAKGSGAPMAVEKVQALIETFSANTQDHAAALVLERSVSDGADPLMVGDAFSAAATAIAPSNEVESETKKNLFYRAARIYDGPAQDKTKAEAAYANILELDAGDEVAANALEDLRKQLGKYEELVELLLQRSQTAPHGSDRARALGEIGRLYAGEELSDPEQALVAYTQAFCEDPSRAQYAHEVERLAGTNTQAWNEALQTVTQAIQEQGPNMEVAARTALLIQAAKWNEDKVGRPDMALFAYQNVLQGDPSNDDAHNGLASIYRKAQQWPELLTVLSGRADMLSGTPRARDLRTEAAEILETKLNDPARAFAMYEAIFADDPGHIRTGDALARIAERSGDFTRLVHVLERRAEARRGNDKADALVKVAEVYEDHLSDLNEAMRRYEMALAVEPKHMGALKGLDRIYNRTGRYRELLDVLERQVSAAATPRQKIGLYERIAALHDEEFLDHAEAARVCQVILSIDSAHDGTLTAMARHLRALDQWEQLVSVLDRHVQVVDASRKTELLVTKARVLADQVGSPDRALRVYEEILKTEPDHPAALEAVAQLKEVSGDAHAALSAIESLANKAATPEQKGEQWMRAGRLLESRGDRDGAIERYKLALECNPRDLNAAAALRKAYLVRGDGASVIALLERELEFAEGDLARARLLAESARVYRDQVKDKTRAELAAKRALELDASNAEASMVLGDIAYEAGHHLEASRYFESLIGRIQALPKEDGTRVLVRFIESFGKSHDKVAPGSIPDGASIPPPPTTHPKLIAAVEFLQSFAPNDVHALAAAATVVFEHGEPRVVQKMYSDLFAKYDADIRGAERVAALYHLGESARRGGDYASAVGPLREALKLDPNNGAVLRSIARIYDETGDWEEAIKLRKKRLETAAPADRFEILFEIGNIEADKMGDRVRAQRTYALALQERSDDRRLLTKLMQLYSEEKDWTKLVAVVTKLADFADEAKHRAKYMHTAATICNRHLNMKERALSFYERALEFDPTIQKASDEAIELYRAKADFAGCERLLNGQLDLAKDAGDGDKMVKTLDRLATLYGENMKDESLAVDALEAAQAFDPENEARAEKLAELYAKNPDQFLDKAVETQMALLRTNPYRVESYKLLRRLYTTSRRADSAWCLCQALTVLNLADPDEEKYFAEHRQESAAPAQAVLDEDDWTRLAHPDLDPLITRIFSIIQPVIIRSKTQSLEALGYDARYALDTARHPYPISQTMYYAAGVLGMGQVKVFQNPNDPGGLGFVHAHEPAVLMGQAAFQIQASTQTFACVAGRHFTYFRPGLYVRHLLPTGTGLKAWLFASLKMNVPNFPVSADIQGQVNEAMNALSQGLTGPMRELLASTVSKLIQSGGAVDLKKWVAAIDLTADRVGFLLAHDLSSATEFFRAEGDLSVPVKERMKEIVLFSISNEYMDLRRKLGIAIS